MSVNAGIQTAHRTDSHGHRPQNSLTCSNIQIRHFLDWHDAGHGSSVVVARTLEPH
jgi:hypothetical protein